MSKGFFEGFECRSELRCSEVMLFHCDENYLVSSGCIDIRPVIFDSTFNKTSQVKHPILSSSNLQSTLISNRRQLRQLFSRPYRSVFIDFGDSMHDRVTECILLCFFEPLRNITKLLGCPRQSVVHSSSVQLRKLGLFCISGYLLRAKQPHRPTDRNYRTNGLDPSCPVRGRETFPPVRFEEDAYYLVHGDDHCRYQQGNEGPFNKFHYFPKITKRKYYHDVRSEPHRAATLRDHPSNR